MARFRFRCRCSRSFFRGTTATAVGAKEVTPRNRQPPPVSSKADKKNAYTTVNVRKTPVPYKQWDCIGWRRANMMLLRIEHSCGNRFNKSFQRKNHHLKIRTCNRQSITKNMIWRATNYYFEYFLVVLRTRCRRRREPSLLARSFSRALVA